LETISNFIYGKRGWLPFLWAMPTVTSVLVGLYHGPNFLDDAYITFRYAENLAAGNGLVFNVGEPVLGTTTPLFAAMLAAFKLLGMPIPVVARWLGLLSIAGVVLVVQALARKVVSTPVALAVGMCVALHPDTAFISNAGMETSTSMLLVFSALLMSLQGRFALAGGLGGAAFLMRPDGVLVVALAVIWQPLATAAIVALPWLLYAAVTYGSPIPHSVGAKQLIHADNPANILVAYFRLLTLNLPLKMIFGLGAAGAVLSSMRQSKLSLVVAWMAAYFLGLVTSGIAAQFPWYVTPLSIGMVLLAGYGADQLSNAISQRIGSDRKGMQQPAVASLILLSLAVLCTTDRHNFRLDGEGREAVYLHIGKFLQERSAPGDVVFVGEVGVLSYLLLEQNVVDSSGINSPEVFKFRAEDRASLRLEGDPQPPRDGSVRWVNRTIAAVEPDYIVTKYPWLHIGRVEDAPAFQALYKRVDLNDGALADYRVYERR